MLGDRFGIVADFGADRIFARGHEARLFQQRQVDVAFDVAGCPWIAVPVPGAADLAALLDQADVFDPRLAQPRAGEQAAEAATNDHHPDLVGQRLALDRRNDVGIAEEVRELARHIGILRVALGAEALVALFAIFGAECDRIEAQIGVRGVMDGLRVDTHRFGLGSKDRGAIRVRCRAAAPRGLHRAPRKRRARHDRARRRAESATGNRRRSTRVGSGRRNR